MPTVSLSPEAEDLRDKFFRFLVHATDNLWHGPDPEVALEALVEATGQLREHLQEELALRRLAEVE
jgi:hypothetical protein